jgi:hypothetical protein
MQHMTCGQVDLAAKRITLTASKGSKLAMRGLKTETISVPPIVGPSLT